MLGDHLCPLTCVQEESHFKGHLCRGSFSPAEKPRSRPRAFPEVMRGGGWEQSASHSPGRVPSCSLSSEPTFCRHQKAKKKKEKVKDLPKHTASTYCLKGHKRNSLPEVTLNSGDISNPSIRMINSWIVGWLVYCAWWGWWEGWARSERQLTFPGTPLMPDPLSHHQNPVRWTLSSPFYGLTLWLRHQVNNQQFKHSTTGM